VHLVQALWPTSYLYKSMECSSKRKKKPWKHDLGSRFIISVCNNQHRLTAIQVERKCSVHVLHQKPALLASCLAPQRYLFLLMAVWTLDIYTSFQIMFIHSASDIQIFQRKYVNCGFFLEPPSPYNSFHCLSSLIMEPSEAKLAAT
jgi:hypothetical protein